MSIIDDEIRALAARRPGPLPGQENSTQMPDMGQVLIQIMGKKAQSINVREMVIDAVSELTMDGASTFTLTLHDQGMNLLRQDIFNRTTDINLYSGSKDSADYWFRLFQLRKTQNEIELTFIDRGVALLMGLKKPLRASRSQMTRLQFCLFLTNKLPKNSIGVVAPEFLQKQPVKGTEEQPQSLTDKDQERGAGLDRTANIKVKGAKATKAQLDVIEDVLDVGTKMKLRNKLLIAGIMVITQESVAGKKRHNEFGEIGRYVGIFHQDSKSGSVWRNRGGGIEARAGDRKEAKAFFKVAKDIDESDDKLPIETLCENVQRSGNPAGYKQWKAEATRTVDAWHGSELPEERVFRSRFMFSTKDDGGKPQDYWEALGRLMEEVHFARFMSMGNLYLISEPRLMKSRVRMRVSEKTAGVNWIDFDWNTRKRVLTASIDCRADRWIAPPGTVIVLQDCGPADGRWLVSSIRRSAFSKNTVIELKKPRPKLKEPAPEIVTVSREETRAPGGDLEGVPSQIYDCYLKAKAIDEKHYPYVWGGGHARAGYPDTGTPGPSSNDQPGISASTKGYDCSGSTASVVVGHDWGDSRPGFIPKKGQSVPSSGTMAATFGSPGEGEWMTIWANGTHVWIEFKMRKGKHGRRKSEHFGTGRWGVDWSGPGFKPDMHPKAGFTPRHIRGF